MRGSASSRGGYGFTVAFHTDWHLLESVPADYMMFLDTCERRAAYALGTFDPPVPTTLRLAAFPPCWNAP